MLLFKDGTMNNNMHHIRLCFAFSLGLFALLQAGCVPGVLLTPESRPYSEAGFDQIVYMGSESEVTVDLDGRASCDPEGFGIASATWAMLEGPGVTNVELNTVGTLQAFFVTDVPGTYLFSLNVTAEDREGHPDFVEIRIMTGEGETQIPDMPETDACGNLLSS
jgi:hypothetical protein